MPKYVLYIISFLLVACNFSEKKATLSPFTFPENTQLIYHINHKSNFLGAIANNSLWKAHNPYTLKAHELKLLNSLPAEEDIWVAVSDKGHFTAISLHKPADSLSVWKNAQPQILKQAQFGKEWYYTLQNNYLIIGDSNINGYAQPPETKTARQEDLATLEKLCSGECSASVFFSQQQANKYFGWFFGTELLPNTNDWVAFDLFLEENSVLLSGVSLMKEPADVMRNTQPAENNLLENLPATALSLKVYSFDDADKLQQADSLAGQHSFLSTINGIAFARLQEGMVAVASAYDIDEALEQLPVLSENFQYNFAMYDLNAQVKMSFFQLFNKQFSPRYAGVYQKLLVFAPTKELLVSAVNDMQRGNVLQADKAYQLLAQNSASNVSIAHIANLYQQPNLTTPSVADRYRWALFQQTPQSNYYILNFVCEYQPDTTTPDQMTELFRFTTDQAMITPPSVLLNHRTKRLEVAVQDDTNALHLIANNGALLWKKPLDGKIQSPIYQVDLFKNGFLQMAFSTEKSIWVLDRNGNVVEPFPLKYKNDITPLEVFDYDSNREYRFVVAEGTTLHLLDRKGQAVKGFKARMNAKPLATPKHFRIADRDFLVCPTNDGTLHIMYRNGEPRVKVNNKFQFSENPVVLWNNLFTFTTLDGYAVSIDEKGGMKRDKKNLVAPFYWGGSKNALYALSENVLTLGAQRIELLEGKYSRPQLWRIHNNNYVSVNDMNTQKTYLYNDKGALIKNFPVETVSPIAVGADADGRIWIATQKKNNELIVYAVKELTVSN